MLSAVATTAKPVLPLDEEDPLHMVNGQIGQTLFNGVLWKNAIFGVDRDYLYPAIRAVANHPLGGVRGTLYNTYPYLTRADLDALADVIVDGVRFQAPGDKMFADGVRIAGLQAIGRFGVSEAVPLAKFLYQDQGPNWIGEYSMDVLKAFGGSNLDVLPDPKIAEFCEFLTLTEPGIAAKAQEVLDAIAADANPKPVVAFKSILSVTADAPALTLPSKWTTLRVDASDIAKGDSVYTWRKVYGPGNVTFTPNGAGASKDATVFFDGTPGPYQFEVKMSDSRNLTEVYGTVTVTLKASGGSLPSNLPPTANSQSVSVAQGAPTPIALSGSDPEGQALAYFITSQPAHGQITGVAPNVVYTSMAGYTGADNFTFKVMDNAGQSSSATINVTVSTSGAIGLALYEPFDYPAGGLNGKSGTSDVGFSAPWTAASQTTVAAASLEYGSLQTKGGSISELGAVSNVAGSRAISSSALAGNGLLANGATLWFSALAGPGPDSWNNNLQFAIANSPFSSNRSNIETDGPQLGSGVGFNISSSGPIVAVQYKDPSQGAATSNGTWNDSVGLAPTSSRQYCLIVGKIVWGATSDTIELYQPKEDLFLPPTPFSVLTTNVDQSTYDTITIGRANAVMLDEIRIGATYQSVLQGTVAMTPDNIAPQPNPMTFDVAAASSGVSSISMVAATASDPTGVEYYFTCTAGGGHDSGWQSSPSYTDTGLTPGVLYSYTVKSRDRSPARNQTAVSAASSAMIPSQATVPALTGMPQGAAESAIVGSGLAAGSVTTSYSSTAPAGTVISQSPAGSTVLDYGSTVNLVVSLGYPRISPTDIVDDKGGATVTPGTLVTYTLTFSWDMDAATIDAGDFSNAGTAAIHIGAVTEISPGVFTVEVTPTNDGSLQLRIAAGSVLLDFGGRPVDMASAITDDTVIWSTTDTTAPTPNPLTWAVVPTALSQTQVTMTAATAADPHGPVQYFFQNNTNGSFSGWINSATWVDTGLTQNTSYSYKMMARDVVRNQTSWSASATVVTPPEADPPLVVSFDPADGATAVPLNSNFTVTFNETIKKGGGNITIRNTTDSINTAINVTDAVQVTVSGAVMTINPTGVLLGNKNYAILMPAGVIKDSVNNNFAGIAAETTWNFTSGPSDAVPPTIVSFSPVDGATGVGLASNLVATFSEEIVKGTSGNITLKNLTDATDIIIPVTDAAQASISGAVLTINPTVILDPNKDYAVRIDAGAIYDKSGNAFGGIADITTWNIRTITPPALTVHTGYYVNAADSWNIDTNWDNGTGRVPAGATSVEIAATKAVVAKSTSTPPYTGGLTISNGGILKVYNNAQDINALGSGTITMKTGASLSFISTQTRTISRPIQLLGNASITTGASTSGSTNITFNAPIDGTFNLSLFANSNSQNHLAAANSFDGVTASAVSTNSWDLSWQLYADAPGSLGVGNVTMNNTVSLVINAANSMADSATLTLNGQKSSKVVSKLIMNASETIAALYIDGVKQPDGIYDTSSSWLTGTGVLTVGSPGGVDGIRPTLVGSGIADNRNGGPIYTDSLVTYTVTFSEDIDASTVSLGDFGNAGTCAATFGTLSEISPGVFTVQVTPTGTGTLILWIPAGAVIKDIAGNAVVTNTAILDDTTITVTLPPDLTPPTVASLDPPDDATNVAVWSSFKMTFSEDIKKGTGNIILRNLTNASDTVINVTDPTQVLASGPMLTIRPPANLLLAKSYAILIPSGAIQDLSGNSYAGTGNETTWNFSTMLVEPVSTFVGANKDNADNWNVAANWNPSGIPTGATSVVIPAAKKATSNSTTTPRFEGNLTLGAGAYLGAGYGANSINNYNALGTPGSTTIYMGAGSWISFRDNFSPVIPAIQLQGNAEITMGSSTAAGTDLVFNYPITGAYNLTLGGKSDSTATLNAANSFARLILSAQWGSGYTINANVPGALCGDLTVPANSSGTITANLVLAAANAISNNATLTLNGPASSKKLKITAPNTVAKLILDGVQQPAGTYGKIYSGAQYEVSWLDSTSTNAYLTVTGSAATYWDIDGATAGAGGAAPAGVWDANANSNWNTSAAGTGPAAFWSAATGQTAAFAAGTDATGSYAVTLSGTHDIGGLAIEEGDVTLSGGGLRMTSDLLASVATGSTATVGSVISNDTARQLSKGGAGTLLLTGANTYTGVSRLEAGSLSVASLANAGSDSPLGNFPTAGAGGLRLVGGTFLYTGSTASTNRGFTQSGNVTGDVNTTATALTLGNCESFDTPGTLTVTGGTGSSLSLGQVRIVEGAQIAFNPTTIPMTVASVNGYTAYPNISALTLGGTATGNVITGTVSVTNPPGSAYTQPLNIVKSGTSDWTIGGVFSSAGSLTVKSGTLRLNGANTYSGSTTVEFGNLIAGRNAPSNADGAFGKATSEVNLGVAGGSNNAAILIGGPYTVGRIIRIPTTNNTDYGPRVLTIGGNTADNSVFSGTIYIGSTSNAGHGCTLTAASGGTVTFSGAIQNPATMDLSYYTVTKAGAGTVVLTNNNTYTGDTLVSEGTLALVGGSQSSPITVASGASLRFTLGSPTTSTSSVNLTNGTVKITGTVDNVSDYLLMTASTIIGTPVLDSPIPNYTLQKASAGTQLKLVYTPVSVNPYDAWSAGAAFDADPNGDGVKTGMAWILGAANPSENALTKLPATTRNGGNLRITFRCLKSSKRGGAQLKVQSSSDLGASDAWTSHEASVPDADSTVNGVIFDTTDDGDYINVIADIPAVGSKLFGRLVAVPAP